MVVLVLVAVFGDGSTSIPGKLVGLTISPDLSPELRAALDVDYSPDRSVTTTTIEEQTNIENQTNVDRQTIIVNVAGPSTGSGTGSGAGGSTIAEGRPAGECFTVPGDVIVMQGGNGECEVTNGGNLFFVAPTGRRSWLREVAPVSAPVSSPVSAPVVSPVKGVDGRWLALVPLDEVSTDQLMANYTRNGGRLPWGFRFWLDGEQRVYLLARPQAWQ